MAQQRHSFQQGGALPPSSGSPSAPGEPVHRRWSPSARWGGAHLARCHRSPLPLATVAWASTSNKAGLRLSLLPHPCAGRNQRSSESASAVAAFPASRRASQAAGASQDLALLSLASSASADLRFRRAESLLPCGLTQDELSELLGRYDATAASGQREDGMEGRKAVIGRGVVVTAGGPAGGQTAASNS